MSSAVRRIPPKNKKKSARKISEEHGGTANNQNAAEKWVDGAPQRNAFAAVIADELAKIAQTSQIKLTAEDFKQAVQEEAKRHPTQADAVIKYYTKNQQAAQALQAQLLEEKIMDYVIKQAKTTDKAVSVKDLYAYDPDAKGKK